MGRTHAREMEAVHLYVPLNMILTPMYRQVLWPGGLDVGRMEHQECTHFSKALCWIDYAMSCNYGAISGDYNSFNGYTSNVCQVWMDNKIADLERKRDGAGKYGRIFGAQIEGFRQCTVTVLYCTVQCTAVARQLLILGVWFTEPLMITARARHRSLSSKSG